MDESNKNNFWNGKSYSAYYEKKGINSDFFSIQLMEEQPKENVYFIVENPSTNINMTIMLKAKLSYEEK
ncbi:MAG: hypothetical protein ACPLZG_13095 [Thermoproteota archaeon]|jgi:hypothetical protein